MRRRIITVPEWPPTRIPYSPAVLVNDVLYVSGIVGQSSSGEIPDTAGEQMEMVLRMLKRVIEAAGGSLADVTANTVYLKNTSDFSSMNAIYKSFFPNAFPARCTVRADMMHAKILVELSSVAHLGSGQSTDSKQENRT